MRLLLTKLGLVRIALFLFWYLACFPGKLGYDYSLLTRMVQNGESTAWWGASYFWIFKVLTFSGSQIYILSFLGLLLLTYSLYVFISCLPTTVKIRERVLTLIMATPLYGVFGVTVSHDIFQTSGLILLSSVMINFYCSDKEVLVMSKKNMFIASFCLLTTQTGVFIILFFCLFLFLRNFLRFSLILIVFSLGIYFFSNAGIQTGQTSTAYIQSTIPRLMLIDIKCIVQHEDVEVDQSDWIVLERYATKAQWLTKTSCSNPDELAAPLDLGLLKKQDLSLNRDLIRVFISLTSQSPAIPLVSHIQRSRVALPPPFFQPPTNQIPWDVSIPLGEGTNAALQSGPGLLHPSVDESSVDHNVKILIPLELIAQALTLLINQASWFWGWGGLWLWPLIYFVVTRLRELKISNLLFTLSPTLLLHLSLFLIGPSSLGRYVMSTILQGSILLVILINERLERN